MVNTKAGWGWRSKTLLLGVLLALAFLGFQVIQVQLASGSEVVAPTPGEAVASLPYAAHAPVGSDRRSGLTRSDPRSSPGMNILCIQGSGLRLDGQGRVDRRWPDLADVLVPTHSGGSWVSFAGQPGPLYTHRLTCLDAEGKRLWTTPDSTYHHSIDVDDQGRIVTLSARVRDVEPMATYEEIGVVLFSPGGKQLKVWPAKDLFGPLRRTGRLKLNSVHFLRRDHPVMGRKGDVMVAAVEGLGAVAFLVFDPDTGAIRWKSRPPIEYSHDAHVLDNGHILALDNGEKRGWSRAVEIDPATNKIVWEYKQPATFWSRWGGSVQRLRNGNTLLADTDKGRAFEITPGGEVVWEWFTPIHSDAPVTQKDARVGPAAPPSAASTPAGAQIRDTLFWIRRLDP